MHKFFVSYTHRYVQLVFHPFLEISKYRGGWRLNKVRYIRLTRIGRCELKRFFCTHNLMPVIIKYYQVLSLLRFNFYAQLFTRKYVYEHECNVIVTCDMAFLGLHADYMLTISSSYR